PTVGCDSMAAPYTDTPGPGIPAVVGRGDVEFFHPEIHLTVPGLSTHSVHLRDDLHTGDHLMPLLGKAQRYLFTEPGPGSGDEKRSCHGGYPLVDDADVPKRRPTPNAGRPHRCRRACPRC